MGELETFADDFSSSDTSKWAVDTPAAPRGRLSLGGTGSDELVASDLQGCAEKFIRFSENWNVPATAETLKMFLACALDGALINSDITAIGDDLWEHYYQQILAAWVALNSRL